MSLTSKLAHKLSGFHVSNPSAFASMLTRVGAFIIYGSITITSFEGDVETSFLIFSAVYGLLILTLANIFYYRSILINPNPLLNSIGMVGPLVTLICLFFLEVKLIFKMFL